MKHVDTPDYSQPEWNAVALKDLYALPKWARPSDSDDPEFSICAFDAAKSTKNVEDKVLEEWKKHTTRFWFGGQITYKKDGAGGKEIYIFNSLVIKFWGLEGDEENWCQAIKIKNNWRILESGEEYWLDFHLGRALSIESVDVILEDKIVVTIKKSSG